MFDTAFRTLMVAKNDLVAQKKREKYTRMGIYTFSRRSGVNSIPENFTLLTTTKWSNSDICVNKANPPGDCCKAGEFEGPRTRLSSFNHRFYLVNKTIIPLPVLYESISRWNRCMAYPPGAFDQKCNLHPFMSRDWNICELIRATGLSPAIIRDPALCLSSWRSPYLYLYPSLSLSLSLSLLFPSLFIAFFLFRFFRESSSVPVPIRLSLLLNLPPEADFSS